MSAANEVPETWELSGDDAWETLRATGRLRLAADAFRRFRAADGTSHARSLAFLGGLILIQGLVIAVGLAVALGSAGSSELIVNTIHDAAPGSAGRLLTQAVTQAHQAGSSDRYAALIVGLVTVIVTGAIFFGQLERGLNRIYGIEQDRPTARKYGRGLVLALSAGVLVVGAFVVTAIGRSVGTAITSESIGSIWSTVRWPVGFLLVMTAIALMFRWSPRRRQPAWSWLAFGALVAVVLWTIATVGLSLTLRLSSTFGETYGPLAGMIALLLWSFLTSVGLLYGAAVTAQLEAVRAGAPAPRDAERADVAGEEDDRRLVPAASGTATPPR